MVSYIMFKSLSHFEFIFVHGVRMCSNFIDLHAAVQLSQHHLLRRPFPILYSCLFCQRLIDRRHVGFFWALYSVPLICMSVFVPVPHCFDYCIKWLYRFAFPLVVECSTCSTSSRKLGIYFSCSNRSIVVSHCGLICISLMIYVEHLFICL